MTNSFINIRLIVLAMLAIKILTLSFSTLAECPKIVAEHSKDNITLHFQTLPMRPNNLYYLLAANDYNRSVVQKQSKQGGYILPIEASIVYLLIAKAEIENFTSYRILDDDNSKGGAFIHHPLPDQSVTGLLASLPGTVETCPFDLSNKAIIKRI